MKTNGSENREIDETKVRQTEIAISYLLRTGVVLSVILVSAGLGLTFAHHSSYLHFSSNLSYHSVTSSSYQFPHTIPQLFSDLGQGKGRGLIGLGLIILILTPVLRVAVGVLSFIYEKDPPMALVTTFVLAVLILSFFLG
jgi:uncharacterized membrane protein